METKEKTVFIEYSTNKPEQHFMTIVQTKDHQRIIIGRVFREYNAETKKTIYHATDYEGNKIFADIHDLSALKKKFIEHGQSLANTVPNPRAYARQNKPFVFSQKPERVNAIKELRDQKTEKTKSQEVSKLKPNEKAKEIQKENQKELSEDSKNVEQYKDVASNRTDTVSKENVPESIESDSEQPIQSEQDIDITSERMEELEELRDQDNDREQDLEIDM
jgi:nicotinamide mononucleotide adenylyltransferase